MSSVATIECRKGNKCEAFKLSKCPYRHSDDWQNELMATKEYQQHKLQSEQITKLKSAMSDNDIEIAKLKASIAEVLQTIDQLRYKNFDISTEWQALRHDRKANEVKITRCKNTINCKLIIDGNECKYFHPKSDMLILNRKRQNVITRERLESNIPDNLVDAKYYNDKYITFGQHLKSCLNIPDELLSIIRSYCCIKPPTIAPEDWFGCSSIIKCPNHSSRVMICCTLGSTISSCDSCYDIIDFKQEYIIIYSYDNPGRVSIVDSLGYRRSQVNAFAKVFHPMCCNELGYSSDSKLINNSIRGDIKYINKYANDGDTNGQVYWISSLDNMFCLPDIHQETESLVSDITGY